MFRKIISMCCILLMLTTFIPVDIFNSSASAYESKVEAEFTVTSVVKNKIENIHIQLSQDDSTKDDYKIFLPNGFLVIGTSADYTADVNGTYYFTVYESSTYKKTFSYTVNDIGKTTEANNSTNTSSTTSTYNMDELYRGLKLQYDYEENECLLHCDLNEVHEIKVDGSTYQTNILNHYIDDIEDDETADYTIYVDGNPLSIRVERQGEFYLMSIWQTISEKRKMYYVNYRGYNFASSAEVTCTPANHLIDGNDSLNVVLSSYSGKKIFVYDVESFDTMRPYAQIYFNSDFNFEYEAKDNRGLDYYINYDGSYVDLGLSTSLKDVNDTIEKRITYNGDYYFTFVDTSGNREFKKITVDNRVYTPYIGSLSLDVHKKDTSDLFKSLGNEYDEKIINKAKYKCEFTSYMNGKPSNKFAPDSTISRAEMITILCRITDLTYDISKVEKLKFTDVDNHWAYYYIGMGYSKKYISGKSKDIFDPDGTLSRAEFCTMICNIKEAKSNLENIPSVHNYKFQDINTNWAKVDILKMANRNVIYGTDSENFGPTEPITRQEVVYAINRIYGLNPSTYEMEFMRNLFKEYYNFNDVENAKYYDDIIISTTGFFRKYSN